MAQAGSSSSLKPPGAGSTLKVTGQRLSRSALEISQAPTMSLAASVTGGVPARGRGRPPARAPAAQRSRGITNAELTDMRKRLARRQWRRHGDGCPRRLTPIYAAASAATASPAPA